MFFGKRSPFALRVKTKRALLFGVKKEDFAKLCEQYKNIFREIHKKKKHNLKIIKNIMIKTIMTFCNVKGIKINNKYKDNIQKAINELNKEIIPIDILKNQKLESAFNEIDDEINQTIEDFDKELSHLNSELNIKDKNKKLIKKANTSNVKKCKKFLFEESNSSNEYESIYYSSLYKRRKKKNHKKNNNNKTIFKSNIRLDSKLEKKIDFNFSESDNSEKTEELKTELKETTEIGPNTLLNLPQPLIDLIKSKIKDKNSFKKDDKDKEENIFICINNNYNYESNIKNINTNNMGNNMDNIKKYKKSSSNITFKKILNNINGEQNLKLKNKEENKIHKKSNFTSVSLFHLKDNNFSLIGYNDTNDKKLHNNNKSLDLNNLSSSSVCSFEITRRYTNINQATEGIYINNTKFQENTMKFIEEYKDKNFNKNNLEIIKKENSNIISSNLENKKINSNFKIKEKNKSKINNKSSQISKNDSLFKKKKHIKNNKKSNNSNLNNIGLSSKYLVHTPTNKYFIINSNIDNNNVNVNSNNLNNFDYLKGKFKDNNKYI